MGSKEKVYRQQGLCGGCSQIKTSQYYCDVCKTHRKQKRDTNKLNKNKKLREKYSVRKFGGFCSRCGKVKTENSSCEDCLSKKRQQQLARKLKCIKYYGTKCKCCTEQTVMFLTIDHINGNGNSHRRKIGGNSGKKPYANSKIYSWLIRNKFPVGYQAMCFNCNRGKWMNGGICPHKDKNALKLSSFNLNSPLDLQLKNQVSQTIP